MSGIGVDGEGYVLTSSGEGEANRILRSHRLWESYLHHVGTPDTSVHAQAHLLEHVSDGGALDYLDGLLGHPNKDPHGKEIPPRQEAAKACNNKQKEESRHD